MENKIYVAIGKNVEEKESILNWALKISKGEIICVIHVYVPTQMVTFPIVKTSEGFEAPGSAVEEAEIEAFRECERQEVVEMLDDCRRVCALNQVPFEKLYVEKESVTDGLLELISQLKIRNLVMGSGSNSKYSRSLTKPLSKKANYVLEHAPDFCHIWFVGKDHLITREGLNQPRLGVEGKTLNASSKNEPVAGSLSQELSLRLRFSDFGEYEASSDGSSRVSFPLSPNSLEAVSGLSSPRLSPQREVKGSDLELLALPPIKDSYQDISPSSALVESSVIDDLYDQLEQAITDAENSKKEAFEESMKRRKAEKEALVSARKVKATQMLYYEELREKKLIEEELAERKKELEVKRSLLKKFSQELHEALDQKLLMENKLKNSYASEKEMEEKLLSAVDLLQKYKSYRDEMEVERDHALQEAEELRKQLAQGPSGSHVSVFSEISFSDVEIATNYFDPSLKIEEGGYGSTYKGFLHHTEVAIKMLKPNSNHGPLFEQEVNVLSKLQHPNLVTLIGACPNLWALVYEYLPKRTLEDRLICYDNTPPVPWQTRIHIATQLCSVLIFLHSRKPNSIIHGDLKPENILLDDNFVCKLNGFGICHVISNEGLPMEQAAELESTFTYIDPNFLATGELTPKSDIYSFGIILLRLLTGKPAFGITKVVEYALGKDDLTSILDTSAGNWPFVQAEQLAHMALRCCDMNQRNRPDLASDIWRILEPMKASSRPLPSLLMGLDDQTPHYFICPVFQEIMEDPQIATDGFTYEAEAIRGWLDSGHHTSPMTNKKLPNHDLIPNHALRSAIQEWLQHRRSV